MHTTILHAHVYTCIHYTGNLKDKELNIFFCGVWTGLIRLALWSGTAIVGILIAVKTILPYFTFCPFVKTLIPGGTGFSSWKSDPSGLHAGAVHQESVQRTRPRLHSARHPALRQIRLPYQTNPRGSDLHQVRNSHRPEHRRTLRWYRECHSCGPRGSGLRQKQERSCSESGGTVRRIWGPDTIRTSGTGLWQIRETNPRGFVR